MLPDELDCSGVGCQALTPLSEALPNECPMGTCADAYPGEAIRDFMAITKALADENRVRVLLALERGELCVCQIVELMGLAISTVSKHMSILKQARLVEGRKRGRWMYYRLAGNDAPEPIRQALAWVAGALGKDPDVVSDRKRLAVICTSDPHELCVAQGTCTRKCKQL